MVRYEHDAPGELLHIDTKKLGRIVRPSHRVTGNRRDSVDGAGWETLFVAIDGHAHIAFTAMHPDEKKQEAVTFLHNAVAYYAGLGVRIKRLLTDNGAAFRSREFAEACNALGVQHKFTRPYRPQTNGKAERLIQSALREWAYGWTYQNSAERSNALANWLHGTLESVSAARCGHTGAVRVSFCPKDVALATGAQTLAVDAAATTRPFILR